jgi:DNA polymerase III alpha subunit
VKIDNYGKVLFSQQEIFESLYFNTKIDLNKVTLDSLVDIDQFNDAVETNADTIPLLKAADILNIDVETFDKINQNNWFMPDEYKNFQIEKWLLDQCENSDQVERIQKELNLFQKYNMLQVLLYLKYLVDTIRKNNIVCGVGRGSSVASYALFLIGVHKIDSLKYQLDINEFLKED